MRKNKKIFYGKGLITFFVFFFAFSFITNIASATTFGYVNENNETLACGYDNKSSCDAYLVKTYPEQKNIECVTGVFCTDETVYVDSQKDTAKSDVYTFLAPLTSEKTAPNDIGVYFNWIFTLAIGLCGALAVIMIVIGGVQYMGEESIFGKTKAREQITNAIFGLLIALGAFALLNTINPDLLKTSIKIEPVYSGIEKTAGGGYFGVEIGATGTNANTNITTYDSYLKSAAAKYGLSCTLLKAFMYAESSGVNGQTSPDNAQGLMQLLPGTFNAQGLGGNIMDPATNIMAGASYIKNLQTTGCNGKPTSSTCNMSKIQYLAAAYNGGAGANKDSTKCKGMTIWQCPQTICNDNTDCFKETRIYAPRVEDNLNKLTANGWGC